MTTLNEASIEELQTMLAQKLALPKTDQTERVVLSLTVESANGFQHNLTITKQEGQPADITWEGDHMLLTTRLNALVATVQKNSLCLI